jgi:hypothetical protein
MSPFWSVRSVKKVDVAFVVSSPLWCPHRFVALGPRDILSQQREKVSEWEKVSGPNRMTVPWAKHVFDGVRLAGTLQMLVERT